jgi:hydrogenase nickel incorporation protein HypB
VAVPLLPAGETIELGERVLARNDELAEGVRHRLADRSVTAVNVMSSPGSGKTSLLERTIGELRPTRDVVVVEGDQATTYDADRIRGAGARAVQVNTGAGCHLDAAMVGSALDELDPPPGALLFIENVGNLVCPALFDVGEHARVVVVSVTEGDDKPLKYPHMFSAADLVVLNKTDLLPHVDFDPAAFTKAARSLNPGLRVLPLSVRDGTGIAGWYAWLERVEVRP